MPFPDGSDPRRPTDLDRMQLAFAVQVARRIVDADGLLDVAEIELLSRAFPTPWMRACGFLDDADQLTPAVDHWYREALAVLPERLELQEKLELVTLFHRASIADGQIHERELETLMDAARRLHIPRAEVRRHLGRLKVGGTLVPPVRPAR